jgi:hypothetical protein
LSGGRANLNRTSSRSSATLAAIRRRDSLVYRAIGAPPMQFVLEYERHAAECREMAADATNPRNKKQLEDMAEVWERLAAQRRRGIVENEPDSS